VTTNLSNEETVTMSKKAKIWYGFLDAGKKSSPIIMDPKLDTGDPNTLYIYNFNRNQILEYKRDIIEPKLRVLSDKEAKTADEIKKAYNKARKEFTPRRATGKGAVAPATASTKPPDIMEAHLEENIPDDVDLDLGDDVDFDDD
jgi:hypothetical protein